MKFSHRHSSLRKFGFTLIELLVVVGVISLLLVMTAPTMSAAFKGSKLTQGAEAFRNLINQAHQTALKNNSPVEVRFYSYDDPDTPETKDQYLAARLYLVKLTVDAGGVQKKKAEAIGNILKLPAGVVISDLPTQSTLLDPAQVSRGRESIKGISADGNAMEVPFLAFEIRADGSVNLDRDRRWFLTFMTRDTLNQGLQSTPPDYVCLQVNVYTSDVRWYHPN